MTKTTSKYSRIEIKFSGKNVAVHIDINLTWLVVTIIMLAKLYITLRVVPG